MDYQTYNHTRNYGCRITEMTLAGWRAVAMENEKLRVTVLADKGANIYEFLYKPRDTDFMWRTRTGLRPQFIQTNPRAQGPHTDYYEGGWQEMFPNCGALSLHQGAEVGQHGEASLLPWRYVVTKDEADEIEIRFDLRTVRTPFHLIKTLSLRRNEAKLRLHEKVTNESGQAMDFTWGHHPALGWPFLDESCRVDLPACRIRTLSEYTPATSRLKADQLSDWPFAEGRAGEIVDLSLIPGPQVESHDMVFLEGIREGWYAVTNTRTSVGFALHYPADVFRALWYWQVYRGARDYPFWSATYNIALEPCATLPVLARAAEQGQALRLDPNESREINLIAAAFEGADRVGRVDVNGEVVSSQ